MSYATLGVSFEELARTTIVDVFTHPGLSFETAAEYVLKKNEELYRRLSKGPK